MSAQMTYRADEVALMAEVYRETWKLALERGWTGRDPGMTRRLLAIAILGRAQEIGFDREKLKAGAIRFLVDAHRRSTMRSVE